MIEYAISYSTSKKFQVPVGAAWVDGLGATPLTNSEPEPPAKVNGIIGTVIRNHRFVQRCVAMGATYVQMDKPYFRNYQRSHVRFSVNRFQPYEFLTKAKMPPDRLSALYITRRPMEATGPHVLFAGSSQKFCDYLGLGDATVLAQNIVAEIRSHTSAPIIYRPKPSWRFAMPINDTEFSYGPETDFYSELLRSRVVVAYGSNAALEALLLDVPAISVGPTAVRPISETELSRIDAPRLPDHATFDQYLANLAYCIVSKDEIRSGMFPELIRRQLEFEPVPTVIGAE